MQGGIATVVNIVNRDSILCNIVPYAIHRTQQSGVEWLHLMVVDDGRIPLIVNLVGIEIVGVVSCGGYYVHIPRRGCYHLVSELLHIGRVGIFWIPAMHNHIVHLYGSLAFGVSQSTPNAGLLAKLLDKTNVTIGEGAELLYGLLVLI